MKKVYQKWIHPTQEYVDGVRVILSSYQQWTAMRQRCKPDSNQKRIKSTYLGCTHVDEWYSYDVWMEWAKSQVGFQSKDCFGNVWDLDKDLILSGNKLYSPFTCCFLPREINTFLVLKQNQRGAFPLGVDYSKRSKRFRARIRHRGKEETLGYFDSPELAAEAYVTAKVERAKYLADKYEGQLDIRASMALRSLNKEALEAISSKTPL